MAKLKLKQKEWFTLADAAKYLTDAVQGQAITEADVIHFISIGELAPSIYFSEKQEIAREKMEYVTDERRISFEEMRTLRFERDFDRLRSGRPLPPFLQFLKDAPGTGNLTVGDEYTIAGLWDVKGSLMDGNPLTRKMLHRAIKGETITPEMISQIISELSEKDKRKHSIDLLKLDMLGGDSEPDSPRWEVSIPLESLVKDSIICVRSHALQELFENDRSAQTGPSTKEKKTYLKIIRALCEDHEHLDLSQHSTAAGQIIAMADTMGLTIPSKRTLEPLLKEARDLED